MRGPASKIILWCALAFTLTMAWLPNPPPVPGNPNDKIQHIMAFACLSLVGAMAYPAFPLARLGERLSFLGAIVEVVQSIPALHRDCDIGDWIADTAAIIFMLLIVRALRLRERHHDMTTEVDNPLSSGAPSCNSPHGRAFNANGLNLVEGETK